MKLYEIIFRTVAGDVKDYAFFGDDEHSVLIKFRQQARENGIEVYEIISVTEIAED